MATEQIAVRLSADVLSDLDTLVADGTFVSRAAAVRAGIDAVLSQEQHRRASEAITDGYRRFPPTDVEGDAAVASMREAIAEEPW